MALYGHMKAQRRLRSTYPEAMAIESSIRESAQALGEICDVVNVREAKDQPSGLLERAARGEKIIVTSDGRPKAMIVADGCSGRTRSQLNL